MSDPDHHYSYLRATWRNVKRQRSARIDPAGSGQESVWDYPRPPRVEVVVERICVYFADRILAESVNAYRVIETASPPVYYLPANDVRMEYLEPSNHSSLCEWKGLARYWSVRVDPQLAHDVAWSYAKPDAGFEAIRDCIAFYAGKMDACYVGEHRVRPQPGDYYGGWVTANVLGPFKGEPGTEAW